MQPGGDAGSTELERSRYLNAFGQLLAALGRRYDGDERLSVAEFSGSGDFSEKHIAYMRDKLGAPGPGPDESSESWAITASFVIRASPSRRVRQLVAANVDALPATRK